MSLAIALQLCPLEKIWLVQDSMKTPQARINSVGAIQQKIPEFY